MIGLRIKTSLLRIREFLKLHWKLLAGGVAIVATIIVGSKVGLDDALKNILEAQQKAREEHKTNLAELQAKVDTEIQQRQFIERTYNDVVTKLETDHEAQTQNIAKTKEKEIKEIIARNKANPEVMATRLNELFGINVVQLKELP